MAKNAGKRRADEDAGEMTSPLDVPELSEEQTKLVDAQVKLYERAEIAVDEARRKILAPVYAARREAVKKLPRFWGTALAQHPQLAVLMIGQDDMKALSYLTDLWVEYGKDEPRAFTVLFEFSSNPYFSDKTLKKEYKYTPPSGTPALGANVDANGVSDAQEAFRWDTHVTSQAFKINWKDDAHNLTKLSPRVVNPDDANDVEDLGSFFNWFEKAEDTHDVGQTIVQDVYPEALKYYRGEGELSPDMIGSDEEMDSDDDEDEDDDDDEEIDLEQPRKKVKRA